MQSACINSTEEGHHHACMEIYKGLRAALYTLDHHQDIAVNGFWGSTFERTYFYFDVLLDQTCPTFVCVQKT